MTGAGEETRGQHADIRARVEAATAGPWETEREPDGYAVACGRSKPELLCVTAPTLRGDITDYLDPADAEFIAHARTDLPRVLDELDAALATIAAVRAAVDHLDVARAEGLVYTYGAIQRVIRDALDGADTGHGDQQ